MRDVCNFISEEDNLERISFAQFVYEVELRKLKQPFFPSNYYLYLSAYGTGKLKTEEGEYDLKPGVLFLVPPWKMHEIISENDFTYLYISFNGEGVEPMLSSIGVKDGFFVSSGYEQLLEFWMKSVRRVNSFNGNFVTSAVFMHTLSYAAESFLGYNLTEDNGFSEIIKYIDAHCTDNINLKMVADMFFYSEKYFSHLFKMHMRVNFTEYLNDLRMRHALSLIDENVGSVAELSSMCGYGDSYYFSKVFKKHVGLSPSQYLKQRKKESIK